MPHLLIAGTTGSGKSVCVNSILTSFLLHNSPDDLRLVLVDPKRVELTNYNGIPHLLAPVIVEVDRVVGALQWMTREMDKRYHLFAKIGARNIGDYNARMKLQERQKTALSGDRDRRTGRPDDDRTGRNRADDHASGPARACYRYSYDSRHPASFR